MQELQDLFTEAVSLHQHRELVEAEKRYLQLHLLLPENINVLANLGLVCRDLGKFSEAETYCRKTIALAPDDPNQQLNLGAILESQDNFNAARQAYESALAIAPGHPKVLNNLGKLLHQMGLPEKGLALIEQALSIEPNYPLALNNLGIIHSERGDLQLANACLEKSVALDPHNVNALYNLAGICNTLNKLSKAQACLQRVLAIDANHHAAKHMFAALSGTTPPSAPRSYVEEIFDKYAHRFDNHLQATLGYTAPAELAKMVRETLPETLPLNAALDLGCGTGLSGASFRDIAKRLVGVDVSGQMLAKAREKNLYDHLVHDEILAYLQRDTVGYDLYIAADVLVYLGDPAPLFAMIATKIKGAGIIACSIERALNSMQFSLLPSGRYAHNCQFLETVAAAEGFRLLSRREHRIRKENGKWLAGDLFLFTKTDH